MLVDVYGWLVWAHACVCVRGEVAACLSEGWLVIRVRACWMNLHVPTYSQIVPCLKECFLKQRPSLESVDCIIHTVTVHVVLVCTVLKHHV